MQRPNIPDSTWSYRSRLEDNLDNENAWPELSQGNRARHSTRKNIRGQQLCLAACLPANNGRTLDDSEYPLLGETSYRARESITPEKIDHYSRRTDQIFAPGRYNNELKKSKHGRRCKRTDKIYINLEDALKSTRCLKKINAKDPVTLKVNVRRVGENASGTNVSESNKNPKVRRINIRISNKRPTKLKKIILRHRDLKARINVRKREAFEIEKMQAIAGDVNAIDFSALKITADPEIDVNYVKGMTSLNFYGKDYRDRNEGAMSEGSVCHRPDVINKLKDLHIQGKRVTCQYAAIDSANDPKGNTVEDEILNRTLCLGIDDDDKREIKDCVMPDNKLLPRHSRNFREYCTNMLTPGLNESLKKFLCEIARLQRRHYDKDPNRAKYRRRYYSGLKEVQKHVELGKVKFAIIAPDVEKIEIEGGLDEQVHTLIDTCKEHNVVFCFGLRRRALGYYTHGRSFVGSIGIANYGGTEEIFRNVLVELVHARNEYQKLSGRADAVIDLAKLKLDDYLMSESINVLMHILSPLICKSESKNH